MPNRDIGLIEVNEFCIEHGIASSADTCPLALAVQKAMNEGRVEDGCIEAQTDVLTITVYEDDGSGVRRCYDLPPNV